MAAKGTAAKSASGASMSKYDVEVEARLVALEAAVEALKSHTHSGGSDVNFKEAVLAVKKEKATAEQKFYHLLDLIINS